MLVHPDAKREDKNCGIDMLSWIERPIGGVPDKERAVSDVNHVDLPLVLEGINFGIKSASIMRHTLEGC